MDFCPGVPPHRGVRVEGVREEDEGAEEAEDDDEDEGTPEMEAARRTGGALPQAPIHTQTKQTKTT